ncbi:MAG TPA: hypothetical protein VLS89_18700 [Candidatus Nanopelagicales bacterium]|nr:hypothetical protein [Candidatus Nanopelagicales bacterium]
MRRRRWQVLHALRVLLACLVLTLSARPLASAPVWTETAVLVVAASSAASAAASAEQPGDRAVREVSARALAAAPVASAAGPLAEPSAPPARGDVAVEDLYLHHCALLR